MRGVSDSPGDQSQTKLKSDTRQIVISPSYPRAPQSLPHSPVLDAVTNLNEDLRECRPLLAPPLKNALLAAELLIRQQQLNLVTRKAGRRLVFRWGKERLGGEYEGECQGGMYEQKGARAPGD